MRTRSIQKTAFLILALNLSIAAQTNGARSVGFSTTIHGVPPSVTSFGFGGQNVSLVMGLEPA
jgi:3-oxoacyl-(acyl-carrier-protein) synthase